MTALAAGLEQMVLTVKPVIGDDDDPDRDIKLVWNFDWTPSFPVGVLHREFFGRDGLFRTGPEDAAFDALYAKLLCKVEEPAQEEVVRGIERYVFDQAKALFLHPPSTLFAFSERVEFLATTPACRS